MCFAYRGLSISVSIFFGIEPVFAVRQARILTVELVGDGLIYANYRKNKIC
jgi:hypothetical protein